MKIYFDMDDVGCDFRACLFDIYSQEYGEDCGYDGCDNYYIEYSTGIKADAEYFKEVLYREGLFLNLKPIPGYIEIIKKLIDEGYEVRILSHPQWESPYCMNEKIAWIKKHMPFFNLNNIIFAKLKGEIGAPGRIFIDDAPRNLEAWEKAGGIGIAFGQYKYTKEWKGYKVNDFDELYDLIKKIEKENNNKN